MHGVSQLYSASQVGYHDKLFFYCQGLEQGLHGLVVRVI